MNLNGMTRPIANTAKSCSTWLKDRIWLVVLVLGLSTVGGICWEFFRKYAEYLPHISHDHAAWGSFGSLLSAFVTCAGFVITIATLLFLNSQNKSQTSFIEWQKNAQGFDRYLKQRQLFVERLKELQTSFEGQIRFRNAEKLYDGIFPDNYLNTAGFSDRAEDTARPGQLLDNILIKLDALDSMFQKTQWSRHDAQHFTAELIDTTYELQFDWTGPDSDGDIKYNERNTGINIYSIDESITRVHSVIDALLYFAGRPEYPGFAHAPSGYLREALIDYFNHRPTSIFSIVKNSPYLSTLETLLRATTTTKDKENSYLFPRTLNALRTALRSRSEVAKLHDGKTASNIYDIGYVEGAVANERDDLDDETRARLNRCIDILENLQVNLAYNGGLR